MLVMVSISMLKRIHMPLFLARLSILLTILLKTMLTTVFCLIFYNDYSSTIESNIIITGNTISGNGNDGVDIVFDSYSYAVHDNTITIANNTITGNGDNGVEMYFDAYAGYANGGNKDVVIINDNNISNNGADGIYIESYTSTLWHTQSDYYHQW